MQNAPERTSEQKISWGGGREAPDPLEVVGPESPPGARVTQNSRYATDGLEMLTASSSRIAITSLQLAQFGPHNCGMKAATRAPKY